MKKSFGIISVLILLIVSLTACGDSSDKLVGTWDREPQGNEGYGVYRIVFYDTGDWSYGWVRGNSDSYDETYCGTYTVLNDSEVKLTITEYNEESVYDYSLQGDQLTISANDYNRRVRGGNYNKVD